VIKFSDLVHPNPSDLEVTIISNKLISLMSSFSSSLSKDLDKLTDVSQVDKYVVNNKYFLVLIYDKYIETLSDRSNS
jgi:hypothetical protein